MMQIFICVQNILVDMLTQLHRRPFFSFFGSCSEGFWRTEHITWSSEVTYGWKMFRALLMECVFLHNSWCEIMSFHGLVTVTFSGSSLWQPPLQEFRVDCVSFIGTFFSISTRQKSFALRKYFGCRMENVVCLQGCSAVFVLLPLCRYLSTFNPQFPKWKRKWNRWCHWSKNQVEWNIDALRYRSS